eukprot:5370037-Pyramimonas_sp.AAC.2
MERCGTRLNVRGGRNLFAVDRDALIARNANLKAYYFLAGRALITILSSFHGYLSDVGPGGLALSQECRCTCIHA